MKRTASGPITKDYILTTKKELATSGKGAQSENADIDLLKPKLVPLCRFDRNDQVTKGVIQQIGRLLSVQSGRTGIKFLKFNAS